MLCLFHSLVGSKGSPKSSDKALLGGRALPLPEQDAIPLITDHQGGAGRKESRPSAVLPYTLSVALSQPDPSRLGMGDAGPQTPTPMEVLRVVAQGAEVKSSCPGEARRCWATCLSWRRGKMRRRRKQQGRP